jgi:hypothetical protein
VPIQFIESHTSFQTKISTKNRPLFPENLFLMRRSEWHKICLRRKARELIQLKWTSRFLRSSKRMPFIVDPKRDIGSFSVQTERAIKDVIFVKVAKNVF